MLRVFFSDGTSAMIMYRMARFFRRIRLGIVGAVILKVNKTLNSCVIGRGVSFGEGFVLMHPVGVVINGAVTGGKNVVLESGVVLGASRNGFPVEVPELGSNIFIGAGAKIIGKVRVGDNVTVGANAVVLSDVPDNSVVVGVPAREVKRES
ncbi:MAG: serine acetyltransferase [Candidatus Latescibacteria bacterium]|nr:serine acetyltransferase [bacterium]MBD3424664.1 serine acetyltransferase [Candidatus Latescibacterota bacterium]